MSDDASEGKLVTTLSDTILLERLRQGDEASFEVLFYRHYDRIYGLLFRLLGNRTEAEDVTQELFLKLYKQPLDGRKEHNVSAWLYRAATNMAYNHIRGRNRRWQRNRILLPDMSDDPSDPAEAAVRNEAEAAVRAALLRLPERQSRLLLLRQMGLSYAELAEVNDIAPGSVGKLLSRAADNFREAYHEEQEGRR
jgi:RNA polymerase sigma-70 factor (ECF subfamily)